MEILLSFCIGIGLSAACGFRVFIPFLVMNLAVRSGHATVSPDFQWITNDAAFIAFATAATLEIAAYYVPWLDNLLDTIMTPAAIAAGTILTASQLTALSPFLQWTLAIIAGGGTAGAIQGGTVLIRGTSTIGSVGLGNSLISTAELTSSFLVAALAILLPIVTIILLGMTGYFIVKSTNLFLRKRFYS